MADIAAVFNWGPGEMAGMTFPELARWREKARVRIQALHGKG